jgi:serine protease Do
VVLARCRRHEDGLGLFAVAARRELAIVAKRRTSATSVESQYLVGEVEGKRRAHGRRPDRDRRHAHRRGQDGADASAAAPTKMPELKTDFSPVDGGKSSPIASYADIVEPVRRAVVSIKTSKTVHERMDNPILRQFFGDTPDDDHTTKEVGLGSGVIVSPDGYILTNNHVVEGADELKVVLSDDREFPAKVVGADPKTDVAVVKIDTTGLQAITFADSDKLRVGDVVFAVGNPLDVGETVTMGIVSAKSRDVHILDDVAGYEDFIQTDAAINLGNSGGALVDAKGRLVGINSAIVSPSRGNIGIGFAVPVNLAAGVMKSLIETGTVTRGFLGVASEPLTPEVAEQVHLPSDAKGVIVTEVTPDGPAEKGGRAARRRHPQGQRQGDREPRRASPDDRGDAPGQQGWHRAFP